MLQLVLASESPRRKTILSDSGFSFHVFPVKVSENLEKNLTVDEQIIAIARKKALAAFEQYKPLNSQNFLLLSADTMVIFDNQPLGKPENPEQACQFLRQLSGKTHLVKTAIYLVEGSQVSGNNRIVRQDHGLETTAVTFYPLSEEQIQTYVQSGEPMDKAGAYGIQGAAGKFVSKIEGHFDNVVGLPMTLFKKILAQNNWTT